MKPTRGIVKPNTGLWNTKHSVWYQKNKDFDPEVETTKSGEKIYVVKSKHGNFQSTDRREMVDKMHKLKFQYPDD